MQRQRGQKGKSVDPNLIYTLVTLLQPWIRRFTMIICAWWLRHAANLRGKKSYVNRKISKMVNF